MSNFLCNPENKTKHFDEKCNRSGRKKYGDNIDNAKNNSNNNHENSDDNKITIG